MAVDTPTDSQIARMESDVEDFYDAWSIDSDNHMRHRSPSEQARLRECRRARKRHKEGPTAKRKPKVGPKHAGKFALQSAKRRRNAAPAAAAAAPPTAGPAHAAAPSPAIVVPASVVLAAAAHVHGAPALHTCSAKIALSASSAETGKQYGSHLTMPDGQ